MARTNLGLPRSDFFVLFRGRTASRVWEVCLGRWQQRQPSDIHRWSRFQPRGLTGKSRSDAEFLFFSLLLIDCWTFYIAHAGKRKKGEARRCCCSLVESWASLLFLFVDFMWRLRRKQKINWWKESSDRKQLWSVTMRLFLGPKIKKSATKKSKFRPTNFFLQPPHEQLRFPSRWFSQRKSSMSSWKIRHLKCSLSGLRAFLGRLVRFHHSGCVSIFWHVFNILSDPKTDKPFFRSKHIKPSFMRPVRVS